VILTKKRQTTNTVDQIQSQPCEPVVHRFTRGPYVTIQEMLVLDVNVERGHDQRDTLRSHTGANWNRFFIPFYGKLVLDCFYILRFLHFSNNRNEADKT
jgi:hypothetical protein